MIKIKLKKKKYYYSTRISTSEKIFELLRPFFFFYGFADSTKDLPKNNLLLLFSGRHFDLTP